MTHHTSDLSLGFPEDLQSVRPEFPLPFPAALPHANLSSPAAAACMCEHRRL